MKIYSAVKQSRLMLNCSITENIQLFKPNAPPKIYFNIFFRRGFFQSTNLKIRISVKRKKDFQLWMQIQAIPRQLILNWELKKKKLTGNYSIEKMKLTYLNIWAARKVQIVQRQVSVRGIVLTIYKMKITKYLLWKCDIEN
jgi:hypothetical protein